MLPGTGYGIGRIEFPVPLDGATKERRFRVIVQGPAAEHGPQHAGGMHHQLVGVILNRAPQERAMGEVEANPHQRVEFLIQLTTLARGKPLLASPEADEIVTVVILIVPKSHLILESESSTGMFISQTVLWT